MMESEKSSLMMDSEKAEHTSAPSKDQCDRNREERVRKTQSVPRGPSIRERKRRLDEQRARKAEEQARKTENWLITVFAFAQSQGRVLVQKDSDFTLVANDEGSENGGKTVGQGPVVDEADEEKDQGMASVRDKDVEVRDEKTAEADVALIEKDHEMGNVRDKDVVAKDRR